VLGFILAVPVLWRWLHEQGDTLSLANYSAVGSYLQGSVASLFSLGGLLLIYATFLSQQQQIAQQDKELETQKAQVQAQHESMKRQNFESSFFQLLNLQNDISTNMRGKARRKSFSNVIVQPEEIQGKDCFQGFYDNLRMKYGTAQDMAMNQKTIFEEAMAKKTEIQLVEHAYMVFYKEQQKDLSHYFRNLYHVVKFVAESDMENKRRYTSLIRAQLSAYELVLLFYNCVTGLGEKFKPLIEEYGLLEHLDLTLLFSPEHSKFYNESAYK
jgi:hypothetical protein